MSAILSADDLNDFISPGVACIKPVETLPKQQPQSSDSWEVTTEDKASSSNHGPAQISLTDCLACSGCVTSAEAVLISLQSHQEVLNTMDAYHSVDNLAELETRDDARLFVASVSPHTRASLAATYGITEVEAGYMVEQLLGGFSGLKNTGKRGSSFTWVLDTSVMTELCQTSVIQEMEDSLSSSRQAGGNVRSNDRPSLPILASACPGWICYAEKTHPHVLPHMSRVKSPQALAGTMLKSVLSRVLKVSPAKIWHLAIMPCFDKKLEASREELTDTFWTASNKDDVGIRDTDCVITARELVMLADSRGISLPSLPRIPIKHIHFPDTKLDDLLFSKHGYTSPRNVLEAGPSGGYAYSIIQARQLQLAGSTIDIMRGRNSDVVEYVLTYNDEIVMKTARYFGFRNIQNLVRKLKPEKRTKMPGARVGPAERRRVPVGGPSAAGLSEYAYIEVMACPGGCTNGGGQIKIDDVTIFRGEGDKPKSGPAEQKQWLSRVDEAYYSAESSDEEYIDDGHDRDHTSTAIMRHWSAITETDLSTLLYTSYRAVQSDVGKETGTSDMERVAGLASTLGGGW